VIKFLILDLIRFNLRYFIDFLLVLVFIFIIF